MDRNSAIGMVLIAALLMLYFYLSPTPPPQKLKLTDSTSVTQAQKNIDAPTSVPSIDSTAVRSYGNLGSYLTGNEEITTLENADLKLQFSNNAILKNIELKNFKTYTQQPLFLINNGNNSFALRAQYEGKEINLYKLFYQIEKTKKADTTIITYSATIGAGTSLKHIYSIPAKGFEIGYKIESSGLTFSGENLSLFWNDPIALQEKDMKDSRGKTTINYYFAKGEHDYLSDTSTDPQEQALAEPVKWASIKQKFFISGIIAKNSFSGGDLKLTTNVNDPAIVKNAMVELFIPTKDVAANKANFTYYFGPNDYKIISEVTPGFSKNLSLGWPPMLWVNKFMVIPAFKFLESFIGNYGIIIVLLVLMVKLLLLPLSYSSYLGMAKMRLLKPETDAIKEKNGDNMAQAQQDTMKLYKQVGVNPFSGCIPLIVQMPFLFALFYFFPISIELRQKAFLWAEDLSTYDSILNLPFEIPFYGAHVSLFVLLMTASTLIYTWQNNQMTGVTGPMKSMGYIMPVVFLFVLNSFAAGLSFYYFVSNLVTFSQQAIIKRFVDEDKIKAIMEENRKKAAANGGTGGTKSKFMAKLEEAMKASEEAKKAAQAKKKK
jgi:YidC/Oxa1 family membrane protein insertase